MRPRKGKELWNYTTHELVFYEVDDDTYITGFENIRTLIKYMGLEYNKKNYDIVMHSIYRALKRPFGYTEILGSPMHMYLIDIRDDEEDSE